MQTTLTRRDWFKSTLALTAGLSLTSSLTQRLLASPMSEAEKSHWGLNKPSSTKIRLNANENPYGPSEKSKQAIIQICRKGIAIPFR